MTGSIWTEENYRTFFAALGGTSNIAEISCCTTRLRMRLHSKKEADRNTLSALPGVKGLIERTDEIQLIIGLEAAEIFRCCTRAENT
jgi:glucose-like phosphotransferase system IIB component